MGDIDEVSARRLEQNPDVDVMLHIKAVDDWQSVDVWSEKMPDDVEIAKLLYRASVQFQERAGVTLHTKRSRPRNWWKRWLP